MDNKWHCSLEKKNEESKFYLRRKEEDIASIKYLFNKN